MVATPVLLVLLKSFSSEPFFVVSLIGLLVVTELTRPFRVTPAWQGCLRWVVLVGLGGLAYEDVRRILEIIPPRVF